MSSYATEDASQLVPPDQTRQTRPIAGALSSRGAHQHGPHDTTWSCDVTNREQKVATPLEIPAVNRPSGSVQSRLGQSDVGHAKGPPLAFPMFYLLASSVDSRDVCPSPSIRVDVQLCISHNLVTVYC